MRVETDTNLVFDEHDDDCRLLLSSAQGKLYAFVQCLDTGMNGNARYTARYWGEYTHDDPEGSIRRILRDGGKWPRLPEA